MKDGMLNNCAALERVKFYFLQLLGISRFSHIIDNIGKHFEFCVLDQFAQLWVAMFPRSAEVRLPWKARTGTAMKTFSTTTLWSKWGVMKQLLEYFGDVEPLNGRTTILLFLKGYIHGDEALKELLFSQETFFKDNFMSSLVLLGCVILGTHYKHDVEVKRNSPLQWALDTQDCIIKHWKVPSKYGKDHLEVKKICTVALSKSISSHSPPLLWDDVFNSRCYNKVS